MDIIGPMQAVQGNLKYAVVVVECFSMWIEAKALATRTSATIQNLAKHYLLFRSLESITVDNDTQFDSEVFI
jgi:hypothetical protein